MVIVKALGINENKLGNFHELFMEECKLVGRPIQVIGNQAIMAALIIKRE